MPRLLIMILIAKQDVFLNDFIELRNHYRKICGSYNIPVTIVGYMGDSDVTAYDEESGILHLTCSDKDTGLKLHQASQYIKTNMEYDFVIKTNVSTLVNIQLLYKLINDPRVDWSKIYHRSYQIESHLGPDETKWLSYPRGTYAICSRQVFDDLFDSNANIIVKELFDYYNNELRMSLDETNGWGWTGLAEDTVFGWLAKNHGVELCSLYDDLVVSNDYDENYISRISDVFIEKISTTPSIICKIPNMSGEHNNEHDIKLRNTIEPTIIHICGLLFESCTLTDDDYEKFYTVNMLDNIKAGKDKSVGIHLYLYEYK